MPQVRFDKFYKYDELTSILNAWAGEQPELFKLSSIGKSYQGRDIWLATLTHFATGPAECAGASHRVLTPVPAAGRWCTEAPMVPPVPWSFPVMSSNRSQWLNT